MMRKTHRRKQRGAALVEYGLLVAGVALVSAAAVSIFGHKTNDLIATMAAVLPGAHTDANAPIATGELLETGPNDQGANQLDIDTIVANTGEERLGDNLGFTAGELTTLVIESD